MNVVFLILVGICIHYIGNYSNDLRTQQVAEAWTGESEERFTQVSAFIPLEEKVPLSTVMTFRQNIDSALADAGIEAEEGKRLWVDAYSTETTLTVAGDKTTSEVTAFAVGGDFFLFHPYELLSGSYIYPEDVMHDRVVIDYELAWRLFGSYDLAGKSITIAGKPYYIAGVIRREDDIFNQKTLPADPMIFMSYTALTTPESELNIRNYELVMADPISNFAHSYTEENFAGGAAVVVENSTRYDFGEIFGIFKNFGDRAILTDGVIYPYWENSARVSESFIARQYVYVALLGFVPFLSLAGLAILLGIFLVRKMKLGTANLREAYSDRYAIQEKRREKREARQKRGKRGKRGKREKREKRNKSKWKLM